MDGLSFPSIPDRRDFPWPWGQGPPLGEAQKRDAILLKTTLEGKDFQTARKEMEAESGASGSARTLSAPGQEAFSLEIDLTQVSTLHAELRTPQGKVQIDATNITYGRLKLGATSPAEGTKKDPLVVDLTGDGPATTGAEGARPFDLAGDGTIAPTSFVTGRSAFLALDRNGNGWIDGGAELFGDQHGAANGFEELAKFDANADRRIDGQDPVFGSLQLLFGDGHAATLADEGIQSISLQAIVGAGATSGGDDILYSAQATATGGRVLSTYALGLQRFDRTV